MVLRTRLEKLTNQSEKKMNRIKWTTHFFALIIMLAGCASSANVSNDADAVTNTDAIKNISWLEGALQKEGVFVSPQGSADLGIAATSSSRLVLDGREALSVYLFDDLELASSEAYEFSNTNVGKDVYLKDALVVVRSSRRDTGLSQTLREILGDAL